ncbi:MAG: glycerate kinase [Halobacteriaceae archaeon]
MIHNFSSLAKTDQHRVALDCLSAGISAATPANLIPQSISFENGTLTVSGDAYDLDAYNSIYLIGGGKAAGRITEAILEILPPKYISDGIVITERERDVPVVTVSAGGHPIPSETGINATEQLLTLGDRADSDSLVLAIITGGGSAHLAAPVDPVPLADLQNLTASLLASGASITEINAVRKHISAIKGGKLADRLAPATVVGIVLSDVVGDDLSTIASGPLVADETSFDDALRILDQYDISPPSTVMEYIAEGVEANRPETPTKSTTDFDHITHYIVGNTMTAIQAAAQTAKTHNYTPLILSSRVQGEAREVSAALTSIAEETLLTGNPISPPAVLLSGGETTVTIDNGGKGGPNLEFCLQAAIQLTEKLDSSATIVCACVDTDGNDGSTDVAGGIVANSMLQSTDEGRNALYSHNSYDFLDHHEALIDTGPTHTNVNDMHVFVIE